MRNKLENNCLTSEKFVSDYSVNDVITHSKQKKDITRFDSETPKIVVCPPMEETTKPTSTPRTGRLLKAFRNRIKGKTNDSDSMGSSSSSDSFSGEIRRSEDRSSYSVSESGSDGSERNRRHRSTVSLRRMFESLNLTSRSQSSSPTEKQRPTKKQPQPKRILRQPVTYTYVRGLSGLPTQRIPRHTVYCTPSGVNR